MTCLIPARSRSADGAAALGPHGVDVPTERSHIAASGVTFAQLISSGRATLASFRGSNKRRGANDALIRLEPQCGWELKVHMFAGTP
jgi:catalase (peroxidase I)